MRRARLTLLFGIALAWLTALAVAVERPLLASDPLPDPDQVNSQQLPRSAPDPLDGPPAVTCRAWAIFDSATSRLLWDQGADQPLDPASTTKIMTAYLVLSLAEAAPNVLQEPVVFSPRADQTPGSTAGLRAGEQVPVDELLYGLLLPSGNDAAVALAEHFGSRYAPSSGDQDQDDPLPRFVAEMNRKAAELGLAETRFQNPHGLTADGHRSSARDLARLSLAALRLPAFRDYVNTRQRGCSVQSAAGDRRNLVWKNTNRLLDTEGYYGVKTGTTTAAGACLVSLGRRQDRELLVVVLGSANSAARYVDTRNLFRWAWQQVLAEPAAADGQTAVSGE